MSVVKPLPRFELGLALAICVLLLSSAPALAESPEATADRDAGSLKEQCRQLEKEISRQLAKCRTVFQLGDATLGDFSQGWDPRSSSESVPPWVPQLVDLASKSNLAERAHPIRDVRKRVWQHDRGQGGEYRSFAWLHEAIVHSLFIEALESDGFEISEWTSVPSRQAHALLAGNQSQTHLIVASQPDTCRSLHLTLIYTPDSLTYPYPPSPFEGMMTEIQVSYREP